MCQSCIQVERQMDQDDENALQSRTHVLDTSVDLAEWEAVILQNILSNPIPGVNNAERRHILEHFERALHP